MHTMSTYYFGAALQRNGHGKQHSVTGPSAGEIRLDSAGGHGDNDSLGKRLREIRGPRSRAQFGAELGNTHRNTIENYEKSKRPNVPRSFLLLVIEKNPGWSMEWLEHGRGEKHVSVAQPPRVAQSGATYALDDQLLAEVLQEIEDAFGKTYERVSVEKRAALIAAIYEDARARGQVSRDTVLRLIKLASNP